MDERESFILNVDLRSHENNAAHRTLDIDQERLIVRRGQPFSITVQSPDSELSTEQMKLMVHMGKNNQVEIKVENELDVKGKWWFSQMKAQNELLLTVHSPADAIIGLCRMTVLVMSDKDTVKKTGEISFYLLFNPWCKDDVVFVTDETLLQEYIMNENGVIYTGSWNNIDSRPWNFGQFEDNMIDICFQILDNSNDALGNSKLDLEKRFDPVYISRIISKMVNATGDRGVLIGRWRPPYYGGVSPSRWTGSVPILRQWSRSGIRGVKYGQCWVFAGVACTVFRCLGIPTRVITNYSSAHDVDGNLAVDYVENFNNNNKQDTIWNFHCWVETWMKRNDLPPGNDGWQVLDPTPQELSEGEFCCGPCPVEAIKEGNLEIKYDTKFAFAEVNADINKLIILPNGQKQKLSVDENTVGRNISTKSVYGDVREDVTLQYKYPEGSDKEREVYLKAGRTILEPTDESAKPKQLKLIIRHDRCLFGTDFDVTVELKNEGEESVDVKLTMRVMAVSYNSFYLGDCLKQINDVTVPAAQSHNETLHLQYKNYAKCVSDQHLIRVKVLAEAKGVPLPFLKVSDIYLKVPKINIKVTGTTFVWELVSVIISFINEMPVSLNGGKLTMDGPGLLSDTHIFVTHTISPGEKVSVVVPFTPFKTGVRKLMVNFDSDKLKGMKGEATMVIKSRHRNNFHVTGNYYF